MDVITEEEDGEITTEERAEQSAVDDVNAEEHADEANVHIDLEKNETDVDNNEEEEQEAGNISDEGETDTEAPSEQPTEQAEEGMALEHAEQNDRYFSSDGEEEADTTEADEMEEEIKHQTSSERVIERKRSSEVDFTPIEKEFEREDDESLGAFIMGAVVDRVHEISERAGRKEDDEDQEEEEYRREPETDEQFVKNLIDMVLAPIPEESASEKTRVFDVTPAKESLLSSSESEEESEEEEMEEEQEDELEAEEEAEDKEPEIDREFYLDLYKHLLHEKVYHKRLNTVLMKKLGEHFKRRKVDSAFQDVEESLVYDLEQQYSGRLQEFWDLKQQLDQTVKTTEAEMEILRAMRERLEKDVEGAIEDLLQREREVAKTLVSNKTGKPISEKVLESALAQQHAKIQLVGEYRLQQLRVKARVQQRETELQGLESLGPGLHVLDYEQLRIENYSYLEKIEERETELARLRNKAASAVQILAHVREKTHVTASDIDAAFDNLNVVSNELDKVRRAVGNLKNYRDRLRDEYTRLRQNSGLLGKLNLLRDFEEKIDESGVLATRLDNLKYTFQNQKKELFALRTTISRACTHLGNEFSLISEMFPRHSRVSANEEELSLSVDVTTVETMD